MILPGILSSGISGHLYNYATSFTPIQTVTIGAGGASSISFTSIPSTYTHLQLRVNALYTTAGDIDSYMLFNSDSTSGNYVYYHQLFAYGSSAYSGADTTSNKSLGYYGYGTSYPAAGITDILDYTSTNKNKTIRTLSGSDWLSGGFIGLRSSLYKPGTIGAINSITLYPNSGNFGQYSSFALYGVA